jgi:SAM-dependent methyltransferase
MKEKRFDFGLNWKSYSEKSFDEQKFDTASESLKHLYQRQRFDGMTMLDVGCGSGIFSIAAKKLGCSRVLGIDISPNSVETSRKNARAFGFSGSDEIEFRVMDVLDRQEMDGLGLFDVVYAWGSLHHTGKMWPAIECVCDRVKTEGLLALAIYNRHWSSPCWKMIKWLYNRSGRWIQKIMVWFFWLVIYTGKFLFTGQNPLKMHRGMDFYHDVVDWVGGYPYEYAGRREIIEFMKQRGFILTYCIPAQIPTANNQFLFRKK